MGVEHIAVMIPIVGMLMVPLLVWIVMVQERRKQEDINRTLVLLAEKGQPLSDELLDRLSLQPPKQDRREKDLRWGVLLVAIALAIALGSILAEGFEGRGDMDDVLDGLSVAAVFLVIGLARLGLWKYAAKQEEKKPD